jgi:hypothetical protein
MLFDDVVITAKTHSFRMRICNEFLETERTYVRGLRSLLAQAPALASCKHIQYVCVCVKRYQELLLFGC